MGKKLIILFLFPLWVFSQEYPYYVTDSGIFAEGDYSVTITMPSGIDQYDMLIASIWDACSCFDETIPTPPDGWTQAAATGNAGSGKIFFFWKRADGSEDGTNITFTTNTNSGQIIHGVVAVIRNVNRTDNPTISAGVGLSTSTTTTPWNPPSQSNSNLSLYYWGICDDNVEGTIYNANFSSKFSLLTSYGSDGWQGLQEKVNCDACDETTTYYTFASSEYWATGNFILSPHVASDWTKEVDKVTSGTEFSKVDKSVATEIDKVSK